MGPRNSVLKDLTMLISRSIHKSLFLIALALLSALTFGQSKTSFGSTNATQCFMASANPSSLLDAKICTNAIRHDKLSKRDLAATHTNRGIILAAVGKLHQALEDHNQAAQLKGDLPKIYINRGNVFHRLEEYEKALLDYQKALDLGGVPVDIVQYNRGLSLQKIGKNREALNALEKALRHNPGSLRVKAKIKAISSPRNIQK